MFRNTLKIIGHTLAYVLSFFVPSRPGVVVLLYHSVESSSWPWSVSPAQFERQMRFLSRHRRVVSLEDVVAFVQGERTIPENAVAITFDDGYKDTLTTVLPTLQKYNLSATLFLTTDLQTRDIFGNIPRLDEEDVCELAESGNISVEAHGHSHIKLTDFEEDARAFELEVRTSIDEVKRMTRRKPRFFAYAFGAKNSTVVERARVLGPLACFTTYAEVARKGVDPYVIPRVQITGDMPFELFVLRTTQAVGIYKRLVSSFRKNT